MDAKLFDTLTDVNQHIFRNVVSLRVSEDLFDDLTDDLEDSSNANQVAIAAEMRVKRNIPPDWISRSFHYSTAIDYPFHTEPFMQTRYGDGSYPVWYGSLDMKTTIHETAFHMIQMEQQVDSSELPEIAIVRERCVYDVKCCALLINLEGKEAAFPELVADTYEATQMIGKRIQREGHPGMLVPSARYSGTNVVIFQQHTLSQPKPHCYLTYSWLPHEGTLKVERTPGRTWLKIST